MAKYLLVYVGGDAPTSEDDGKTVMDAWVAWFTALGPAIVDPGNPCGSSGAIASDGSVTTATSGVGGYSLLIADSLDAALEMAKGCPHLSANGSVEVYETIDIM